MINIIRAADAHLEYIAELEESCFSQPWSRESIRNKIADPDAIFLTATEGGDICGYVSGNVSFETVYVNNVAVREDCRGRGAGRLLLTRLEEESRKRGAEEITLEVRVSNIPAVKLYGALGYKILGKRAGFYSKPAEDAYIMKKDLGAG